MTKSIEKGNIAHSKSKKTKGIHRKIRKLMGIIFSVMLILSVFCITTAMYFRSQFVLSPTMILHKEIAEDVYPHAICDKKGIVHVLWQSDRNGNWDIYYLSLEEGAKREDITSITRNLDADLFPSLAEDGDGNLWAIWVESNSKGSSICGKILKNGENVVNEEIMFVSSDDNSEKRSPSLINLVSGRLLLIWISRIEGDQEIRYAIVQNQLIRKDKMLCRTNNAQRVVLGRTDTGRIFALWDHTHMGESNFYLSVFDEDDENFSECMQLKSSLGEPFIGTSPSLAIRENGSSALFFCNETSDICFSAGLENQSVGQFSGFLPSQQFLQTGAKETCPVVVEGKKGEIYLFWASNHSGDNEIYFCHSEDMNDFQKAGIHYERGPLDRDEEARQFVRNLTIDPSQNNSNPDGYFCNDIFFSVATIGEELWVVWDSYQYDYIEENNRREIRYVKSKDGFLWQRPVTIVDSSKSNKEGKDDRSPAITETENGHIWLFWHSDRYITEKDENYEICYIKSKDGGETWDWDKPDEDPFLLTENSTKDQNPSVSSIGNRLSVVWQSDRRFGDLDILFSEFDGTNWSPEEYIAYEDTLELNPSIASYRGWRGERQVVAWESLEEDRFLIYYAILKPERSVFQLLTMSNESVRFPCMCYVSKYDLLGGIWHDPMIVWQYRGLASSSINIAGSLVNFENGDEPDHEIQVTEDFSPNERPAVVQYRGKIWVFWDSNGGGAGRGIYYKYLDRRDLPQPLLIFFVSLLVLWLFFLLIFGRRIFLESMLELGTLVDEFLHKHDRLCQLLIGVIVLFIGFFIGALIK